VEGDVIKIRISGDFYECRRFIQFLREVLDTLGGKVLMQSRGYRNRREPGHRFYVELRMEEE
jgi:hypothetical protein